MSANPTANPTSSAQGTQAPSQIELFWERYRSIIYVVLLAVLGALVVNYGWKKYSQGKVDAQWSQFAATVGLDTAYSDTDAQSDSVMDRLDAIDSAQLKAELAAASEKQKPFLLMAIARKAVRAKDWPAAEAALQELETKYPQHSLVKSTPHPVQAQEFIKPDPTAQQAPGSKPKPIEWKPPVQGSAVSLVRAQIEKAKSYTPPSQFAKPEIPADAEKWKFELSGESGSFTLALMPQTPLHRAAFHELASQAEPFWKGLAIDEIRRPAKNNEQPRELHLGLESSRSQNKDEWTDTEPSKHVVEFEKTKLSHFAGAVSGRNEKDGKSCVDRLWICVDDAPRYDGERVIFAYVVEGLDNLKRVCESTMTAQEEEAGRGKPADTIRIVNVTAVK
jgi:hypothetical protein